MATILMLPSSLTGAFAAYEDLVDNTVTTVTAGDFAAELNKSAKALNDDGLFEVSIKVAGKKSVVPNKLDIVFVLDNSGSMSNTNITQANTAINTFMDTLVSGASDPNIRFGLKTYSDSIKKTVNLTSTKLYLCQENGQYSYVIF